MRPESSAFLWDAKGAALQVTAFITDLDEAGYRQDALRRSAVERPLEIVGEALGNLRENGSGDSRVEGADCEGGA